MKALLLTLSCLALAASLRADDAGPPASVVRLRMPLDSDERRPIEVPSEPENTVEIDFPWALTDWAGRGFTPDPDKYAGDFVIEAARGSPRIFVTPVAAGAHRVLDVVLLHPGGGSRSLPIEFVPAPTGLAWRKLSLEAPEEAPTARRAVSLGQDPPRSTARAAGPSAEIGFLRTMRLMAGMTAAEARGLAEANPALSFAELGGGPREFGDFTIMGHFAVRDATTGMVGICAGVTNTTIRRIFFDPGSWVVRAGDRVYPVRTADFPGEVEPGATAAALLVLARGDDGRPTGLLADNAFDLSVVQSGSANPRPVILVPIHLPESP